MSRPQALHFDVSSDPEAAARLREIPELAGPFTALGFERIALVESVRASSLKRGKRIVHELLASPDRRAFLLPERSPGGPPVAPLRSVLEDGTILETWGPIDDWRSWLAPLPPVSRTPVGFHVEVAPSWEASELWRTHAAALDALAARRGSGVPPHDAVSLYGPIANRAIDLGTSAAKIGIVLGIAGSLIVLPLLGVRSTLLTIAAFAGIYRFGGPAISARLPWPPRVAVSKLVR